MDKNTKDILDAVNFIKERMATKDDIVGLEKKVDQLDTRLGAVESKVDGINHRLDTDAMQRTDLKLPRRLHDLEEEVYGAGNSRHPKHVPL